MAGTDMNIRKHGTWVGEIRRVQCNYCQKREFNFYSLRYHLGNVGTDVTHCDRVPLTTRDAFFKIIEGKEYICGGSPRKSVAPENGNTAAEAVLEQNSGRKPENENRAAEAVLEQNSGRKRGRPRKNVAPENGNTATEADKQPQMCLARFFYEHVFDLSAVDSASFKEMVMMKTVGGGRMGIKIPDSRDLNGWLLQEALKEVQDRVKEIRDSWEITGCSILLDAWIDQKGRDLVSFVADSPAEAVYLKSLNVSAIKTDVNALTSLVNGLLEEVGVHNVTQIIACSTSGWVGELGKLLAGHDRKVFWSVSLSHCFELMLVEIGKMYSFGDILDKVNILREVIDNNPSFLKIFRDHSLGAGVTSSASKFEFVTPYLTLENILRAKKAEMFASSDWKRKESTAVSSVVNDASFWEYLERVVSCTSPLIHGLLWISTVKNKHVGYIYEILWIIKNGIARNFKNEKHIYMPIWDVIDDVFSHHLRNPLHGAGYFLNPTAYYSDHFHGDQEVYTGLTFSLVHMVKESHLQVKITAQIDEYRHVKSCFKEASQADQISGISPVDWWTKNASQHPELQSFSIKILSQTCEGASKYKLKRNLAEKLLLTQGMSRSDKKNMEELAFVHYNLHLQSCKAKVSERQ